MLEFKTEGNGDRSVSFVGKEYSVSCLMFGDLDEYQRSALDRMLYKFEAVVDTLRQGAPLSPHVVDLAAETLHEDCRHPFRRLVHEMHLEAQKKVSKVAQVPYQRLRNMLTTPPPGYEVEWRKEWLENLKYRPTLTINTSIPSGGYKNMLSAMEEMEETVKRIRGGAIDD